MRGSQLRVILFIAFVDLAAFGLIIPFQADYADRMGANGFQLGALIGSHALMQLLFSPLIGRLSDRFGRRPILLVSIGGSVIAHTILGIADLQNSLPLLFVARITDGITGGNIATAQACIADVTEREDRARGMGLFGAAFVLGFVVGPAIGGGLAHLGTFVTPGHGTSWAGFGAAAIAAVAWVLVLTRLPETLPPGGSREASIRSFDPRRLFRALADRYLGPLLALSFFITFAFVFLEVTFIFVCKQRVGLSTRGAVGMFIYLGALMIVVQGGLVGRLARRVGEARMISTGPFITAVGMFLIASLWSVPADVSPLLMMMAAGIPVALGNGVTSPAMNSLISRQAAVGEQGGMLGLAQGAASLARATGSFVAGWLYFKGPSLPYWSGGSLLIVCGLVAVAIHRAYVHLPREKQASNTVEVPPINGKA